MSASLRARPARGAADPGRTPGRPLPVAYTLVLAVVLVVATLYGLFSPAAYRAPAGVRPTLPDTLRGQDLVTLLAAGVLVWSGRRARAGSLGGHIVWLAVMLYVPYTYLMYVVAPYNDALLLYIAAIGLGAYGFINGLVRLDAGATASSFVGVPRRGIAWLLLVVGTLFSLLWLSAILAVWPGGVPADPITYDLPNIVHVLDLGIALPLVLLAGVLLLRGHPVAPALAAIVLVKMFTLGLALLSMNAFVASSGGAVDPAEPVLWTVITVVSGAALGFGARRMRPADEPWLRPSIW